MFTDEILQRVDHPRKENILITNSRDIYQNEGLKKQSMQMRCGKFEYQEVMEQGHDHW